MKVAVLGTSSKFEQELVVALQKSNLQGYALIGFNIIRDGKIYNIDALVVLESGAFICIEAKGYGGKWEGGINSAWFSNGKEIESSGVNPFAQCLDYCYVIKDKLLATSFANTDIWISSLIVAPDGANFSGIDGAVVNQIGLGKSINICNLSQMEIVLASFWGNQQVAVRIKTIGLEKIICELASISKQRLRELLVSSKSLTTHIVDDLFDDLDNETDLSEFLPINNASSPILPTKNPEVPHKPQLLFQGLIYLSIFSGLIFLSFSGFKFWQFSSKPQIKTNSLKIGILTEPQKYKSLQTYLENELVVDDFWRFLRGDRPNILIEGDHKLTYEEAKTQIVNMKWDIVFTLSPMNSVTARDNNYKFLARMFPQYPQFYKSAFIVRNDSQINSIKDLSSKNVMAVGPNSSASSFFMPLYDLYEKTLIIKTAKRSQEIIEMVTSGAADIGAVAYNDALNQNKKIRIIRLSRDIPGSGVYVSSNISTNDQFAIAKVMLEAPMPIQNEANYGTGKEPNYTEFLKITKKVESIVGCSDFSKNPVNLFCTKS